MFVFVAFNQYRQDIKAVAIGRVRCRIGINEFRHNRERCVVVFLSVQGANFHVRIVPRRRPAAARDSSPRLPQHCPQAGKHHRPYFFSVDGGTVGVGNGNVLNIDFAWVCICSCICTNMFFDCSM